MENMKKTVLITGSSRGIGAALAIELSKKGYNIAINYFQSKTQAETIAQTINNTVGARIARPTSTLATIHQSDIRNPSQVQKMINQIGKIDILINNAGIMQQKLFLDITEEEWKNMFAVNLFGAVNCIKV